MFNLAWVFSVCVCVCVCEILQMKLLTFLLLLRAAREEFHQVDCAHCCCFLYGSPDPSSVLRRLSSVVRRRSRCRLLNGFAVCLRRLHRLLFGAAALILSMSSYV